MNNKKFIPYLSFLPLIILSILIFKVIDNPDSISVVARVLSPFLVAFGIAYLLNPMVKYIERTFKLDRIGSIFFTYLIVLGALTFLIAIVTPNIIESITTLVSNTPEYVKNIQRFIEYNVKKFEILSGTNITQNLEEILFNSLDKITRIANTAVNEVLFQAINVTAFLLEIIISIVVSIYMLKDKESFNRQIKRLLYATFDYTNATKIIHLGQDVNRIFSRYLVGKFIDSLIIGIICFLILFLIVRAPFSLLLSVIVGITNMIPYFGPFIGAVPAVIITLFISPIKALWVAVAILVIQQFDGLYLGPKILGDHVGVTPFWIISAITIGGALFGFMGMLLGVPVIAVLRMLIIRFVDKRLNNSNLDI
ncbi:AI-2E family transporter [Clostridium sp. D2Q-11]|uniref:AI-2E family transporter n=1 Tax=Anaeromonas frigoriresistens TaxID=2683708 RepID=A0A942URT7_9FIRM|nr:AI-2E family transporter [Anaeromonas frigoriresistens]MBS4538079.1 AI-2E family transporter [Anaeromonas frigoriresistens]